MELNQLVRLAKAGDVEAFGRIYDLFVQRIFRFVRLKVRSQQEAEDIVQEVFVKAYKGLTGLKMEELNFSAWLYRIASNSINDYFRKKYRTPDIIAIDETFDIAGSQHVLREVEQISDLEIVAEIVTELPQVYRQVLEFRFFHDLSLDETAKVLGKSNLSIRLIQYRALKKMRKILNKKHPKDYSL